MINSKKTLILNQGYAPICLSNWQRVFTLIFSNKAEVVEYYSDFQIKTVNKIFKVPAVVRLLHFAKPGCNAVKFGRNNVYLRDNFVCQYCLKQLTFKKATIDHVVPSSRGGKTTWTNIVTCCSDCNLKKADKTPVEAGMKLHNEPRIPNARHPSSKIFMIKHLQVQEEWKNWLIK